MTRAEVSKIIYSEANRVPDEINLGKILEAIESYQDTVNRKLTNESEVKRFICSTFNVDEEMIHNHCRKPRVVYSRNLFALHLIKNIGMSQQEASKYIGCVDRTTIANGIKKLNTIHFTNPFFDKVNMVISELKMK